MTEEMRRIQRRISEGNARYLEPDARFSRDGRIASLRLTRASIDRESGRRMVARLLARDQADAADAMGIGLMSAESGPIFCDDIALAIYYLDEEFKLAQSLAAEELD